MASQIKVNNILVNSGTEILVNSDGETVDFRVRGDSDTHLIYSDGDNNVVGFGVSAPTTTVKIDVGGSIGVGTPRTNNSIKSGALYGIQYDTGEELLRVFGYSATAAANTIDYGGGSTVFNAATTLTFFTASNPTTLKGTERIRVHFNGGVAIGNTYYATSPGTNALSVEGALAVGVTSTISKVHIVSSGATTIALRVDTASTPTSATASFRNNGTEYVRVETRSTDGNDSVILSTVDLGDGATIRGPSIQIGRNSNATNTAAGNILFTAKDSTIRYVWVDGAYKLRIHSAVPYSGNDTAGTVVGDQTSMLAAKNILPTRTTPKESLNYLVSANKSLRSFVYKAREDGSVLGYGGEEFFGIVTDYFPRYGKDNNKSLNEITLLGDLVNAMSEIVKRIEKLERRII